mgnify:CR=1 FL=1
METTHIICINPDQSLTYLQTQENININDEDNIVELIEVTQNESITEEYIQSEYILHLCVSRCQCMFLAVLHFIIITSILLYTSISEFSFSRTIQVGILISIIYDFFMLNPLVFKKINIMVVITICVFLMKLIITLYIANLYVNLFVHVIVAQYIFFTFLYTFCVLKMYYFYSNHQVAPI